MTADWGLITAAGEAYDSGREADYSGPGKPMTADGKLITGAGKAYDSGRGGFLCAFLFVFSLLFWLLLLFCGTFSRNVYVNKHWNELARTCRVTWEELPATRGPKKID